jgi:Uncharacterized protein conserved in bacteria
MENLKRVKRVVKKIIHLPMIEKCKNLVVYGGLRFNCPVCGGHFRKLIPFQRVYTIKGVPLDHFTKNATCPTCRSEMRHRFLLTFLKNQTNVVTASIKLLHFAPEPGLKCWFEQQKNIEYVPCDFDTPGFVQVDMTKIQFSDNSFDAIVASHVLEHIYDDFTALKELYRILKPGGWAAIAIPVYGEKTYEDPQLDSQGRIRMYGIVDHMRLNGLDFKLKLMAAGFDVKVYTFDDVPGNYIDRSVCSLQVETDKYLFFCKK